ncbi:MAG TPA: hypothetical protein VMB19_09335 [Silvibacterium sp.]|nr:hypothetical protein [Silvibacterium sp.]
MAAAVWMPLALSVCESLRLRLGSMSALGIVAALLAMSNLITLALFAPLMIGYAICSTHPQTSVMKSAISFLGASAIAFGIVGIYLVPLLRCRGLFDLGAMARNVAGMRLANNFLLTTASSFHGRLMPGLFGLVMPIAGGVGYCILRSDERKTDRILMLFALCIGMLSVLPDLGSPVVRLSGLGTPGCQRH